MKPRALILCADGSEEMEIVIPLNLLRRGGVEVTLASLAPGMIRGARSIVLQPDAVLDESMTADALILPGGLPGVEHFLRNELVLRLVKRHYEKGAWVCAICAAPLVLEQAGILEDVTAFTSHPGVEERFHARLARKYSQDRVVVSGPVITSRAPGTAFEFSAAILARLQGDNVVETVRRNVLYPCD
ncbi:MAG: DJ-1 family protein [Deltaproteobacteria bacterium HGW-Deltaproteobacteria-22]|jgi:4-methyl-5(b-hydroxyethyl)-thiazole monophosphate biosynthesis|nr:MAG: DJ-1 family protein [Deltaproteobacteria bacterium HGW-Deltaproteobacteria-22]